MQNNLITTESNADRFMSKKSLVSLYVAVVFELTSVKPKVESSSLAVNFPVSICN